MSLFILINVTEEAEGAGSALVEVLPGLQLQPGPHHKDDG